MGCAIGFIFTWNSRKQSCTGLSTREAEYIAMCEATTMTKKLRTLLAELCLTMNKASSPFCDNTTANNWAEKSESIKRAKHIDLKYHFHKECTANDVILLEDVNSEDNPADCFTKALQKMDFDKFGYLVCVRPRNQSKSHVDRRRGVRLCNELASTRVYVLLHVTFVTSSGNKSFNT